MRDYATEELLAPKRNYAEEELGIAPPVPTQYTEPFAKNVRNPLARSASLFSYGAANAGTFGGSKRLLESGGITAPPPSISGVAGEVAGNILGGPGKLSLSAYKLGTKVVGPMLTKSAGPLIRTAGRAIRGAMAGGVGFGSMGAIENPKDIPVNTAIGMATGGFTAPILEPAIEYGASVYRGMKGLKGPQSYQLGEDISRQTAQYEKGLSTEFENSLDSFVQKQPGKLVDLSNIVPEIQRDMTDPKLGPLLGKAARDYKLMYGDDALMQALSGNTRVTALQAQHIKNTLSEVAPAYSRAINRELVNAFPEASGVHQTYAKGIQSVEALEGRVPKEIGVLPEGAIRSRRMEAARKVLSPETASSIEDMQRAENLKKLARRAALYGGIGGGGYGAWRWFK